ncbi:LOW QUALITY PROTEIN: uncharacterized protein LOC135578479 [Columba livia]|uniref:LOW QUALITY PROTEIN: uncharacterized protein LOC135578479 n=1 Tax=Columba livia TaxID=8932 RepID=UPI0031BA8A7A
MRRRGAVQRKVPCVFVTEVKEEPSAKRERQVAEANGAGPGAGPAFRMIWRMIQNEKQNKARVLAMLTVNQKFKNKKEGDVGTVVPAKGPWTDYTESVVDRAISLQTKSKFRSNRDKTVVCAVLGESLVAAIEDRFMRRSNKSKIIESLENLVQVLQKTTSNLEQQLENCFQQLEKEENGSLKATLKENTGVLRERKLEEKNIQHINQIYPQKELENSGKRYEEFPCVRPLVKTEYFYANEEDTDPHITTKQIPYTATEPAKLQKECGHLPKESETEYVCHVSLTRGHQIQLSEKEANGSWEHGVFLTIGDRRAPWSLTQRAAYWAPGLNPLDRGEPLAITGSPDQLLESVPKATYLKMIHESKLIPECESPVMLPVNPDMMTPLVRGLPASLKSTGINLQRTITLMSPVERLENTIRSQGNTSRSQREGTNTSMGSSFTPPPTSSQQPNTEKVWTWGEVAQELIDYNRKSGPVKILEERLRGIHHIEIKKLPLSANAAAVTGIPRKEHPCNKTAKGEQPKAQQQW